MKINIENCARNLGSRDGHDKGRRYLFQQMVVHLRQLRDCTMAGDLEVLDEFFGLYVFSDGVEYKRSTDHHASPEVPR